MLSVDANNNRTLLFDGFFILQLERDENVDVKYNIKVLEKFFYSETLKEVPREIEYFCFPDANEVIKDFQST